MLPINDVNTFGEASQTGAGLSFLNFAADAPTADPAKPRPGVKRLLTADGANHIVFSFLPGQSLPDHKAAHPITVQAISGTVKFSCEDKDYVLSPGQAVHLPAYLPHAVYATDAPAVMLLTMHTGAQTPRA